MPKSRSIIFNSESVRAILDGRKTQTRRVIKPQPPEHCNQPFFDSNGYGFFFDGLDSNGSCFDVYPDGDLGIDCPYGIPGDKEWQTGMPPQDGYYHIDTFDKPIYLRRILPENYPGEEVKPGLCWGWNEKDDPEAIELAELTLETIRWKRPGDKLWVRETWATLNHFDDIGTVPSKLPTYAEIVFKATDEENMLRGKWRSSLHLPKRFSRITLEIKDVRVERVQDITSSDALREGILGLGRKRMLQNFPEYAQKYSKWRLAEESQRKSRRLFETPIKPPLAPSPKARFGKLWDSINAKKGFGWETNPWVWVIEFEVV